MCSVVSGVKFRDRAEQTANQAAAHVSSHVNPMDVDHAVIAAEVDICLSPSCS